MLIYLYILTFMKGIIKMKVSNMLSSKVNKVANQFIIENDNETIFQSYNSIIAKIVDGKDSLYSDKVYLDEYYYNYSRTTSKYLNMFLNQTSKEIQKNIKDGNYILTNLN